MQLRRSSNRATALAISAQTPWLQYQVKLCTAHASPVHHLYRPRLLQAAQ
jgi:hypothetical protein